MTQSSIQIGLKESDGGLPRLFLAGFDVFSSVGRAPDWNLGGRGFEAHKTTNKSEARSRTIRRPNSNGEKAGLIPVGSFWR